MEKLADIEVTWGDRLRAEGRVEGRVEGERQMLLHLITLMFDEVPATFVTRVNAITDEELLARLAQQIVTVQQLDELVWPESNTQA